MDTKHKHVIDEFRTEIGNEHCLVYIFTTSESCVKIDKVYFVVC